MRKFNLYFALLSVSFDAAMLWLGLSLAYYLRAQVRDVYLWDSAFYALFILKFMPIWLISFAYQGLYRVRTPIQGWKAVARVVTAVLSGWAVVLIYLYLSRSPEALVFPRLIITYGLGLTLFFVLVGRFVVDSLRKILNEHGYGLVRTVVISKTETDNLSEALKSPIHGRRLLCVLTKDFTAGLNKILESQKIDEVVVAWSDLDEKEVLSLLDWTESHFVSFAQVPTLLGVKATKVESSVLAGAPIMYFQASPLDGWGRIFKRLLDLIIVIPAIAILLPIFLILFVMVKISSPGPAIYREKRISQDGREIAIGKFRSMFSDWRTRFPAVQDWSADENNDVRITKIGRVLRRTNLDELPQLWDVLSGQMSLVGPRPEQPKYVTQFSQEVPEYIKRHHVKSGLTGWAQINGLRGNTPISERTKYDLYYIQNWSIWFDIRIILGTLIFMARQTFR